MKRSLTISVKLPVPKNSNHRKKPKRLAAHHYPEPYTGQSTHKDPLTSNVFAMSLSQSQMPHHLLMTIVCTVVCYMELVCLADHDEGSRTLVCSLARPLTFQLTLAAAFWNVGTIAVTEIAPCGCCLMPFWTRMHDIAGHILLFLLRLPQLNICSKNAYRCYFLSIFCQHPILGRSCAWHDCSRH